MLGLEKIKIKQYLLILALMYAGLATAFYPNWALILTYGGFTVFCIANHLLLIYGIRVMILTQRGYKIKRAGLKITSSFIGKTLFICSAIYLGLEYFSLSMLTMVSLYTLLLINLATSIKR